jgi:tricarballylate dehydrogenase
MHRHSEFDEATSTGGAPRFGSDIDVVVVGGGNAGFCAALSAAEQGARVLVLEKAVEAESGGNSFYTAGAFRFAFDGIDDILPILEPDPLGRLDASVVPPYGTELFLGDMRRITEGRCDPAMTDVLVSRSLETVRWMHGQGVQFRLMYERQAYEVGAEWVFWGGLYVGTVDGGKGLMRQHSEAAAREGIRVEYGAEVTGLISDEGRIVGVTGVALEGGAFEVRAAAVVLTAGGFEADPQKRAEYMGPEWANAIVRGTPENTGDVLELALAAGAAKHGDWTSCHSVAWEAGAPARGGERELTNQLTRQSYPIGIVVNTLGERFVDEGADYRNYTYAKYGREILKQPGGIAFQIFDAKTRPLLRTEEYDSSPITVAVADTLDELAESAGIDVEGFAETVRWFNRSILDRPFDPTVKDGRAALVVPPKSNWAQAIDTPPYYAYSVACGITFTFGGLHIDLDGCVLDADERPIEGLFAAGEIVGGLFSENYPGGSGLIAGSVFGRIAGRTAATVGARA